MKFTVYILYRNPYTQAVLPILPNITTYYLSKVTRYENCVSCGTPTQHRCKTYSDFSIERSAKCPECYDNIIDYCVRQGYQVELF